MTTNGGSRSPLYTIYPKFNAAVRAIRETNYTWTQSVESFSHMLDEALHHSKLASRLSDLTCIELWIAQSQPCKPAALVSSLKTEASLASTELAYPIPFQMKTKLDKALESALTRRGLQGKTGNKFNQAVKQGALKRINQKLLGSTKTTFMELRFSED